MKFDNAYSLLAAKQLMVSAYRAPIWRGHREANDAVLEW
jgi:hypothetical protein